MTPLAAAGAPDPVLPDRRHAGRDADRRRPAARSAGSCSARTTASWSSWVRARSTTRSPRSSTRGSSRRERDRFAGTLEIVMRVYFEKPRTTVGWKGLINDPYLDESYRIDEGLRIGRQLLLEINKLGMPAGSEFLDVDLAAVPRRPDRLGRDRRPHDREPGAPRAGLGPVGADRLQERHRRQHPDRDRRDPGRRPAAPLPLGAQERPGRDRRDPRQQGLPRHPARRQGAELRRRVDRRGLHARSRRRSCRAR